jgi:hypothetical protein
LATTVPQIVSTPPVDPTKVRVGNIGVAGTTRRQPNVMVDGFENYDPLVGGLAYKVSPEAIEELNVVTTRFTAEQGRSVGAVRNIVGRSGTNNLHGSGSIFFATRTWRQRISSRTTLPIFGNSSQNLPSRWPLLLMSSLTRPSVVSHEFRTPLTLMLGPLAQVLNQSSTSLSEEDQKNVGIALRNGLRLRKLVNALLLSHGSKPVGHRRSTL